MLPYEVLFTKSTPELIDVCRMAYDPMNLSSIKLAELELIRRVVIMDCKKLKFATEESYYFVMNILVQNHVPVHNFNHLNPRFGG